MNCGSPYLIKALFVVWLSWSVWTCSVTCGQGTKKNHRMCLFGRNCDGNTEERRFCNQVACPGK